MELSEEHPIETARSMELESPVAYSPVRRSRTASRVLGLVILLALVAGLGLAVALVLGWLDAPPDPPIFRPGGGTEVGR